MSHRHKSHARVIIQVRMRARTQDDDKVNTNTGAEMWMLRAPDVPFNWHLQMGPLSLSLSKKYTISQMVAITQEEGAT